METLSATTNFTRSKSVLWQNCRTWERSASECSIPRLTRERDKQGGWHETEERSDKARDYVAC